jgi:hypothetical protein
MLSSTFSSAPGAIVEVLHVMCSTVTRRNFHMQRKLLPPYEKPRKDLRRLVRGSLITGNKQSLKWTLLGERQAKSPNLSRLVFGVLPK